MLAQAVAVSAPSILHHNVSDRFPNGLIVLECKATKEISCNVMVSVCRSIETGYKITSAVRYEDGGLWFAKETHSCFTLREAVKRAYGLSRKLYKVTASRSLAGLLHDSIVPATDDIDF